MSGYPTNSWYVRDGVLAYDSVRKTEVLDSNPSAHRLQHGCFFKILAGTQGHNSEECAEAGSHWDLSMIVKLTGGTFLGLSMIWRFLGYLYDCGTFWGLLMIVTFYRASL